MLLFPTTSNFSKINTRGSFHYLKKIFTTFSESMINPRLRGSRRVDLYMSYSSLRNFNYKYDTHIHLISIIIIYKMGCNIG